MKDTRETISIFFENCERESDRKRPVEMLISNGFVFSHITTVGKGTIWKFIKAEELIIKNETK